MCTNGTAVSPQRSLRKQHRSEHHLNSNGSTPMASEHHLNRHTSMNQNVSSITSSSQLTIPAYQSVAPGGATAGSTTPHTTTDGLRNEIIIYYVYKRRFSISAWRGPVSTICANFHSKRIKTDREIHNHLKSKYRCRALVI